MSLLRGCKRSGLMVLAMLGVAAMLAAACTSDAAPTVAPPAPAPVVVQESATGSQQTGIWVDGTGSVSAASDVADLSFGVETRADTVADARAEAASAMDAVIASLGTSGVAGDDIRTTHFSIQPVTVYEEGPRGDQTPKIVGYRVSNFATARIRDLSAVGGIIDAAAAGGDAVRINGIGLAVDDPQPLEVEARKLALEDATAKAEQIASVMNVTLGDPVYISQYGGAPRVARESVAFALSADASTPISGGQQEIRVGVQVVFAIE